MNLSVELCITICASTEHNFNREQVFRLLMSGADINFQDANRNFNTPLHLAIERRNIDLIKLLLTFYPSKRIRNMSGERPRDYALNLSYFEVVKLLDEYRQSSKPKSTTSQNQVQHRKSADKESFVSLERKSEARHKTLSSYTSSRVQFLMSITKIDPHFKRTSFDMESVKHIYEKLDANILVRPLLKICKEISGVEIYFMFDQTNNELSNCSISSLPKTIFVHGPPSGALFPQTLAHKLLHYAMNHINDNDCKPYRRKQAEKMFRFRKIVTVYKRKIEALHPLIQNVFDLPEASWDAELIACVPYFLAIHQDDPLVLADITEKHSELFDFFYAVVLKDIDDYLVQSNYKKFKGRPVEGSSFGKRSGYDPYKNERLEENYGTNYRHNKRNNPQLERVCSIV